ncbi:MAG TPA: protein kinase [Polyangiaceae bacterium]|nr:protein kinase [Polyangiaceae bacterium]
MAADLTQVSDTGGAKQDAVAWKGTPRYEIVRPIGEGGMGTVYEAFDRDRRQRVALKTLLHFTPAALYRFKQEFRTLADVHHPNLVHLYELVVSETDPVFFTMELVPGTDFIEHVLKSAPAAVSDRPTESLRARAKSVWPAASVTTASHPASGSRSIPCPAHVDRLRAALEQLVEGVVALHAAGKLHRDIKPSNVKVTPTGRVVLLDFGVATEVARGSEETAGEGTQIVGTPRYMAPEQGAGEPESPACDWYSVGVVLYEALCGRPPFTGSAVDVLMMKSTLDPIPPSECVEDVPPELDSLCLSLLKRDPRERPTGPEILFRLRGHTSTTTSAPPPPGSETRVALVGREAQLKALREAFESVRRGHSITVRIPGASGLGKSTLVHHFLDELEENVEAEVLRGRAYERESVPYKAVDAVIDALSRYVHRIVEQGGSVIMPRDVWALARLFPVLSGVPGIALVPEEALADPQALRHRAFVALRDLLAQLARRHPLVVFIDDVQWGDSDSAALLLELMRPPLAPPLLLVMTYREEEAGTNAFLLETSALWPAGAEVREEPIGPLLIDDARRLAQALLPADDPPAGGFAEAVAIESGGSPFLIEELARGCGVDAAGIGPAGAAEEQGSKGAAAPIVSLEQIVRARLDRLNDAARRVLEIVAVGGRPLPIPVVREAGETGAALDEVLGTLRALRFVRSGYRDGHEVVEPTHDRIRETILATLAPAAVRERHAQLARALEATPGADLEALALHLLGAEEKKRAAEYAERAAEQAVATLAFEQATRLFRLTVRIIEGTAGAHAAELRRLSTRLASVLEWSGRGGEAALVYLDAAKGAPAGERIELERAAAEQLLACGRIDEGALVLRRVLGALGIYAPRTALGALAWLLVHRLWLRVIGLRFQDRSPAEVSREDRVRIDALYSVGIGLSIVDVILGACMQSRHLIAALAAGDRNQVVRAAALEAGHLASEGGLASRREIAVHEIAGVLTERGSDTEGETFATGTRAIGMFLRGRWREAHEHLVKAYEKYPNHRAGWHANAKIFDVYALFYLGELAAQTRRAKQLLAEAEQRNDLYVIVNLRTTSMVDIALAADDPETARTHIREAMDQWSQSGFLVQHWKAMVWSVETELYAGDGAKALAILDESRRALRRSFLLQVQFLRAMTQFARARALVAAASELRGGDRVRLAGGARAIARKLDRERMPWIDALARFVSAAAANVAGDRDGAIADLESAVHRANLADMTVFAWVARHQLGVMQSGADGGRRLREAEEALRARDVAFPARYAGMLLPGRWTLGE